MDISFPLLHLPNDALLNALKSMDHLQLAALSFLSKKTRILVKSLKLRAIEQTVYITKFFEIHLPFTDDFELKFCFYTVEENDPPPRLGTPHDFIIDKEKDYRWINSREMNIEEFIDQFKTIFHTRRLIIRFGTVANRYDLESIHKTVRNVYKICLHNENHEFNRKVLKLFKPNRVCFAEQAFQNKRFSENVLIQNLYTLRASCPDMKVCLNNLLITNSLEIRMSEVTLTGKDINRFIKLWMKGSNSRLENLSLRLTSGNDSDIEDIWKGVTYQENHPDEETYFMRSSGFWRVCCMFGGRNIHRMDGTKATCLSSNSRGFVVFEMYVFHEHCKDESTC